jgi:hypothetical protein
VTWGVSEVPTGGVWTVDTLPVVAGVEVASSIIIIACRRLAPRAGIVDVSERERGLTEVTVSGTKLKAGMEGIVGK